MHFQVVEITLDVALATIGNPLALIGKLPTIGKLTIEANGFSGRG